MKSTLVIFFMLAIVTVSPVGLFAELVPNEPVQWEFETTPQDLTTNFYDYMPGSYGSLPVRIQENQDGGIYLVYHAMETAESQKRIYYSYIDAEGNVIITNDFVSDTDIREGYAGVDLDPITGKAFIAWHANVDTDNKFEILARYGDAISGDWSDTFTLIDNPCEHAPNPDTDDFIWPKVQIGASPLGGNYSRVFISGFNYGGVSSFEAANLLIAYVDIDFTLNPLLNSLDWNYFSFPQLDEWDTQQMLTKVKPRLLVSEDGRTVAVAGWIRNETLDGTAFGKAFVLLNENYGEGEFTFNVANFDFPFDNPLDAVGNPQFMNGDIPLENLFYGYYSANHFNPEFNGNNEIIWVASMSLLDVTPTGSSTGWETMHGIKQTTFNLNTELFSLVDITPVKYDGEGMTEIPNHTNGIPAPNWDIDEDGQWPTLQGDDGLYVPMQDERPFCNHTGNIIAEDNFKIVTDPETGLAFTVWTDGLKTFYANNNYGDYESFTDMTELAFAVSIDNGQTWSLPTYMNGNSEDTDSQDEDGFTIYGGYVPELEGMIPSYIYPGDEITDIVQTGTTENGVPTYEGTVHLMFLDDYVYGSSVVQYLPPDEGGMMKYMSLRIQFDYEWAVDPVISDNEENITTAPSFAFTSSYPNPFNPNTSIKFYNESSGNVKVSIYNIIGQKVKTIINQDFPIGNHAVIWDGKNEANNEVTSGVYFYKVETSTYSEMNKMLLLK
jgi:hypothetical protein